MTKQEYLAELRAALSDLSAEEASRACAFYEEMIDDRVEAGEDERDAVAAMEPPAVAAARIMDEMPVVPRALARAQGRRRSGCGTALLWAAVVAGSPLWLSLLAAALAFVLCGVVVLCLPFVMAWVLSVAFLACMPVALFAAACAVAAGSGVVALLDVGVGLGMGGAGLLMLLAALFVTRFFVRLLGRFVRWAASPFWKAEPRSPKPLVGLSPVWRTAAVVGASMLAMGVLLGAGSLASCGFSTQRFYAEQDRVNAFTSELLAGWWPEDDEAGSADAPAAPEGPASPAAPAAPASPTSPASTRFEASSADAGRNVSISEIADALADESRGPDEKSLYAMVSVIAAGLGI